MNSKNSKTSKSHLLILSFTDKLDLSRDEKSISSSNLSIYYTQKDLKSSYNNNKFKISAPTWNDKFELPDGSCSISDIQDYFEYILKKDGENIDSSSIRIYVDKTENSITVKIKTGYYFELLTTETIPLLGNTENKISKNKNGENVPHLGITEVVMVHCNIVKKDYQLDSRVLYTIAANKPFGNLSEISPKNYVFLKKFNLEFQIIEVWFTDQNSQPLEIEEKINLTLVIKQYRQYKNEIFK